MLAVLLILNLAFLWSQRTVKRMVVTVSVTFFGVAYFGFFGGYFFHLRDLPQGACFSFGFIFPLGPMTQAVILPVVCGESTDWHLKSRPINPGKDAQVVSRFL